MARPGSLKSLVEHVFFFDRLPADAVAIAGGKGASLSRMAAAGLPVPPGFVVSADAFRHFLETAIGVDLIASLTRTLDVENAKAFFSCQDAKPQRKTNP